MSADAADMPVKPRMPAMIEITRKIKAHFRSVTTIPPVAPAALCQIGGSTFGIDTGSRDLARCVPLLPTVHQADKVKPL
jgi:hypothetical protein